MKPLKKINARIEPKEELWIEPQKRTTSRIQISKS